MTDKPLCVPNGFRFGGVIAGIKKSGKPDISLIVGDQPLVAAGVYTTNQIVAAPVVWCRRNTPSQSVRAVIANSGNANACTGEQGDADTAEMCQRVADALGCDASDVLVMSTGVIGNLLPMEKVRSGIDDVLQKLDTGVDAFVSAAQAIMTTDKSRKTCSRQLQIADQTITITAMAKGAGMIAPNMATMLSVVTTDAKLTPEQATRLLKQAADGSYNRVSVDGHASTNDTLLLLASGQVGELLSGKDETTFANCLNELCVEIARELVADGEGATHWMKICVSGAQCDRDAELIARTVGASPLVKTAITGADPNWGRIVSAVGYAGPPIEPTKTCLTLCGVLIYENGRPLPYDAASLSKTMSQSPEVLVELIVGSGSGAGVHWASDLTTTYVTFNSEYTT
ncbi:bifunctional glutamate N-acetyltransferase/amino-acid acetyltransferase ArgJ [Stieleria varia]|uniref:Arginine biosynthesis bifunctional protein ArgJ n=1 Tax=Stieleria varia TaxID=2528005 RepID=A0A5C6AWF4_9BACT|nr:bifunctional glutamate N-acetyltransferase/amino-acid acetyltransferase ArgJ [Stieleria varia]TWU04273.1 Arginine biosynthesis bifunctional protein ArgJ [Stieleria varia]